MSAEFYTANFQGLNITVPVGATNAVLVTPPEGAVNCTIQPPASGASIAFFGQQYGQTLSGASLVAGYSTALFLSSQYEVRGPARFYLATIGATASVKVVYGVRPLAPRFPS